MRIRETRKEKPRRQWPRPRVRLTLHPNHSSIDNPAFPSVTDNNPIYPSNVNNRRLSRLEGQYLVMQSQMIGMQSSLDRILGALQPGASPQSAQNPTFPSAQAGPLASNGAQQSYPPPTPTEISGFPSSISPLATNGSGPSYYPPSDERSLPVRVVDPPPKFPPLPGFAPPPHKFATYGIVPSTAPSSDDESEETLPRSSLNAPIEALQGLANAAAEAAAAPLSSQRYASSFFWEPPFVSILLTCSI